MSKRTVQVGTKEETESLRDEIKAKVAIATQLKKDAKLAADIAKTVAIKRRENMAGSLPVVLALEAITQDTHRADAEGMGRALVIGTIYTVATDASLVRLCGETIECDDFLTMHLETNPKREEVLKNIAVEIFGDKVKGPMSAISTTVKGWIKDGIVVVAAAKAWDTLNNTKTIAIVKDDDTETHSVEILNAFVLSGLVDADGAQLASAKMLQAQSVRVLFSRIGTPGCKTTNGFNSTFKDVLAASRHHLGAKKKRGSTQNNVNPALALVSAQTASNVTKAAASKLFGASEKSVRECIQEFAQAALERMPSKYWLEIKAQVAGMDTTKPIDKDTRAALMELRDEITELLKTAPKEVVTFSITGPAAAAF